MNQESLLHEMNDRSREVFRRVVESYLETGEPVGSRTLTRALSEKVSAATIRNVMQDLEYLGLLESPHVSAGRFPTQQGLRLFVDGLMEAGPIRPEDRAMIADMVGESGPDTGAMLDRVSTALSTLTRGASVVLMPRQEEAPLKHIEFVSLAPDRALVILVFFAVYCASGVVAGARLFESTFGMPYEYALWVGAAATGRFLARLSPIAGVQAQGGDADDEAVTQLGRALEVLADLHRELACGHDDEGAGRAVELGDVRVVEDAVEQRDAEAVGLAHPGAGLADKVAPAQCDRQRELLDGERAGDALAGERVGDLDGDAEGGKRRRGGLGGRRAVVFALGRIRHATILTAGRYNGPTASG